MNYILQNLVKDIQEIWLSTWRSLFIGKYTDEDVENELILKVREFLDKEYVKKIYAIFNYLLMFYVLQES